MADPERRALLAAAVTGTVAAVTTALAGCSRPGPPRGVAREADGGRVVPYRYGDDEAQVAELRLPPQGSPVPGVVVLVHGGYWQAGYDRSLQEAVATDLVSDGYAVWNLDYRAVGAGGGWPATFQDVAAGVDLLAQAAREHGLPLDQLAIVGHSAGGTLALWAAGRHRLPAGAPGADPQVRPAAAVTQAGINDLVRGARERLGGGAVTQLMGADPRDDPGRYALASPTALLPIGVSTLVVTGADDTVVPVQQSRDYAAAAEQAGDDVTLAVVAGEGHFEHLNPRSRVWAEVRAFIRSPT